MCEEYEVTHYGARRSDVGGDAVEMTLYEYVRIHSSGRSGSWWPGSLGA